MSPEDLERTGTTISLIGKLGCLITLLIMLLGFIAVVIYGVIAVAVS